MGDLVAFLGVAALVIVTPGQDTALTVRNALLGGRRGGVFTALGVVTGQATWALAASVGVAALLAASEPAFTALKIGGGAYLAYLGAQALRRAMLERRAEHAPSGEPRLPGIPPWLAYRQGLVSNLGNPKIAVFFTSLLPQFATRDGHTSFASLLLLGLLFAAMTLAWLACYAVAVDTARDVVRRAPVRRVLDGVMGAVLVALGLRLALASRQ